MEDPEAYCDNNSKVQPSSQSNFAIPSSFELAAPQCQYRGSMHSLSFLHVFHVAYTSACG